MANVKENRDFADMLLPAYPLDDALDWIRDKMEPEDVFDEDRLIEWALNNGYTKKED